jgi:methyl-accepting chemotaxis protein
MEVKFSLSKKLLLGFGLVIGIFVILSVITFIIMNRNEQINRNLSEQNTPSVTRLTELNNLIAESKLLIKNWVFIDKHSDTPDKKRLEDMHLTLYPDLIESVTPLVSNWSEEDRKLFFEVDSTITGTLFREHQHVMSLLNSFESYNDFVVLMEVEEMVDVDGSIITVTDNISDQLETLISNQQDQAADAYNDIEASTNFFRIFIIAGGLLAMAVGLIISLYLTSTIKRSINIASEAISKLSDGDLIADYEITSNDEVAKLLYDLREMIRRLQAIVHSIINGTQEISSASLELNNIAMDISNGASAQASSTEEVSSSMEEMSANIRQNTENSSNTSKISNKMAQDIEKIEIESGKSMDSIRKISERISVVNDIAFQTNLLALNAAVEAATGRRARKGLCGCCIRGS